MPHPDRSFDRRLGVELWCDRHKFRPVPSTCWTGRSTRGVRTSARNGADRVGPIVLVHAKQAFHAAGMLTNDLVGVDPRQPGDFLTQHRDFRCAKQIRERSKTHPALIRQPGRAQFHGFLPPIHTHRRGSIGSGAIMCRSGHLFNRDGHPATAPTRHHHGLRRRDAGSPITDAFRQADASISVTGTHVVPVVTNAAGMRGTGRDAAGEFRASRVRQVRPRGRAADPYDKCLFPWPVSCMVLVVHCARLTLSTAEKPSPS